MLCFVIIRLQYINKNSCVCEKHASFLHVTGRHCKWRAMCYEAITVVKKSLVAPVRYANLFLLRTIEKLNELTNTGELLYGINALPRIQLSIKFFEYIKKKEKIIC